MRVFRDYLEIQEKSDILRVCAVIFLAIKATNHEHERKIISEIFK